MIADLQNTALSAVLVFSDKVLYPSYATGPSLFGFTPQEDQAAAGTTMWIIGSLAFVVPAVVIAVRCLSRRPRRDEISSFGKHKVSAVDESLTDSSRLQFGRRLFPARFTRKSFEAILFAVLFVAVGSCLAWLFSFASADTDDQTLRFSQQTGPFAVGVFASPGDLPAGPANFAILVQDRITHEVLLDTLVDLTARPSDPRATSSTISATREDPQNKLLQSAELNLSTVGNWSLDISVRRGSQRADLSHRSTWWPLMLAPETAGSTLASWFSSRFYYSLTLGVTPVTDGPEEFALSLSARALRSKVTFGNWRTKNEGDATASRLGSEFVAGQHYS